jgi:hypothetical protein
MLAGEGLDRWSAGRSACRVVGLRVPHPHLLQDIVNLAERHLGVALGEVAKVALDVLQAGAGRQQPGGPRVTRLVRDRRAEVEVAGPAAEPGAADRVGAVRVLAPRGNITIVARSLAGPRSASAVPARRHGRRRAIRRAAGPSDRRPPPRRRGLRRPLRAPVLPHHRPPPGAPDPPTTLGHTVCTRGCILYPGTGLPWGHDRR